MIGLWLVQLLGQFDSTNAQVDHLHQCLYCQHLFGCTCFHLQAQLLLHGCNAVRMLNNHLMSTNCVSVLACHASVTGPLLLLILISLGCLFSTTTLPLLDTSKASVYSLGQTFALIRISLRLKSVWPSASTLWTLANTLYALLTTSERFRIWRLWKIKTTAFVSITVCGVFVLLKEQNKLF